MSEAAGTKTLAANRTYLTMSETFDDWFGVVNDGTWDEEQTEQLALALAGLQRDTFNNAFLPKGCYWVPGLGKIFGPEGAKIPGEPLLENLMILANMAVASWFNSPGVKGEYVEGCMTFDDLMRKVLWESNVIVEPR